MSKRKTRHIIAGRSELLGRVLVVNKATSKFAFDTPNLEQAIKYLEEGGGVVCVGDELGLVSKMTRVLI